MGFLHVFVTKSVGNRFHELSYSREWPPRSREFENRGFSEEFQEKSGKIHDFPCFFSEFLAKTSIFEFPRPRRSFLPSESSWNLFPTYFVTKTWKISAKMKVSNSSRHLPRVSNPSRGSSMMSEGSQPVAQTLHACQEKTDHRVSAKNCSQSVGTKLMTSNWWLIIDQWSWMIDDW